MTQFSGMWLPEFVNVKRKHIYMRTCIIVYIKRFQLFFLITSG
jgi:hypothetical protein